MDVRILRIAAAGAGLLNRLEADVFDHEIDPRDLAAYLADPGRLLVCAVADGVVIGQARGVITRQPDAPLAPYTPAAAPRCRRWPTASTRWTRRRPRSRPSGPARFRAAGTSR